MSRLLACLILTAIGVGFSACGGSATVVATYPGGTVTLQEFKGGLKARQQMGHLGDSITIEEKITLAREIAVAKMVDKQSEAMENLPEIRHTFALEQVRRAALQWQEDLDSRIEELITEETIDGYIDRNPELTEGSGEAAYYFIFLDKRGIDDEAVAAKNELAQRIVEQARQEPGRFPELVLQYSEATSEGSTGLLGPARRGSLPKPVRDLLFDQLEEREISDPLEVPDGIAIFQLIRRMKQDPPSSEDARFMAEVGLRRETTERLTAEAINALREKYPSVIHWLEKPYTEWRDDDVVYEVGPIRRTFEELKYWARESGVILAMETSFIVLQQFIEDEKKALEEGGTDLARFLPTEDKRKMLARAAIAELFLDCPDLVDKAMIELLAKDRSPRRAEPPASLEEGARETFLLFDRAFGAVYPAWADIETLHVRIQTDSFGAPQATRSQASEVAEKIFQQLYEGAEVEEAIQAFGEHSGIALVHVPSERLAAIAISQDIRNALRRQEVGEWLGLMPRREGFDLPRVVHAEPGITLSFEEVEREFVPGYYRMLAYEVMDEIKGALMDKVAVHAEVF